MSDYPPIADHGLVGDLRTVALVDMAATIDWYCCPRFDSPSVFGSLLDAGRGGSFRLTPDCEVTTTKQLYLPDTNVLITPFLTEDGVGEVQDFMPVGTAGGEHPPCLARRVVVVRGSMPFRMEVAPRFGYGRTAHVVEEHPHGAVFRSPSLSLALGTDLPLTFRDGDVHACFVLSEDQSAGLTLECVEDRAQPHARSPEEIGRLFADTVSYWRSWLSRSRYTGRWREMVHRSALTLKLLTYQPTGAIIAAPTTSLPEQLRGERDWDYRYTWIRDAAFSAYALLRLGFTDEA